MSSTLNGVAPGAPGLGPVEIPSGGLLVPVAGRDGASVKGDKGDAGPVGPQGIQGPKGDAGSQGLKGDTGAQGAKGDTGTGVELAGSVATYAALPAPGPTGTAYVVNADGLLYVSNGSAWPPDGSGAPFRGATGPQGVKGDSGSQGPKGDTGAAGSQGVKGDTGAAGPQGVKGDTGAQGPKGDKGDAGSAGSVGAQGPKGDKGDAGSAGPAGVGGSAYDMSLRAFGAMTPRVAASYGDIAQSVKLQRAIGVASVTFRCDTADSSGNLVVELRKNGAQVAGSRVTIAQGSQIVGVKVTGPWPFAKGDVIAAYVVSVGTTSGAGLTMDVEAVAT
ncbi:collagen-like protein [Antrihabitans cavernicola]|uniref:Collagen-like protein n=1 Tax=Antrihabitans cavernicola TaxID=2495913 RepID=A0A5A7S345_9NOCA|nr:collagen-like protein [Spelaeibacter cavernicola]KAA0016758.1 hypothetical protein FOY51_25770 [Spelaeibacter cavernicola]